jgi:hypothetical protein
MGFSPAIRKEAFLRCARRCCVCRTFKGVHIEVHHIVQPEDGGDDSRENAIPLCFDCHAAAGHYNPNHPRGSKYGPEELRGHRKKLYEDVAAGRVPAADSAVIAGLHVRRLVCLSYEQAREILTGNLQSEFFRISSLIQNPVSRFMEAVLADELPAKPTPAVLAGLARPGIVALGTYWNKREDLVAALPEFQNSDERPVEQRDLREGLIGSKLLSGCVAAGLSSAELGMLKVNHNLCGGETWSVEYRVRRPLFVFTLIDNVGTNALAIANVFGMKEEPQGLAPRPVRIPASGRDGLDVSASGEDIEDVEAHSSGFTSIQKVRFIFRSMVGIIHSGTFLRQIGLK